MNYQQYRHRDSKEDAEELVVGLINKLEEITATLHTLEGRHRLTSDPCPVCDVYKHHNHVKTQWRSIEDIHQDYDNNLLILGDDIDDKTVREVFLELKNRFNLTVTPVKLGPANKTGIPSVAHQFLNNSPDSPSLAKAKTFIDTLPVWGLIIDENKNILYANSLAHSFGHMPSNKCFTASTADSKSCPWCDFDMTTTETCTHSVVHDYSYNSIGHTVQSGIKEKDVHWIKIDKSTIIHFAGIRLLKESLKEKIITNWKKLLPLDVPENFITCIDYR